MRKGSTGEYGGGRAARRAGAPGWRNRRGRDRVAISLLGSLLVLGAGLIPTGRSHGQEPPAGADAARQPAAAEPQESAEPLSIRYRFIEKYGLAPDAAKPELMLISEYQVGSLDTIKTETPKRQGAPDRTERTYRTIYTERPARVNNRDEVTDTVRRYEAFGIVKEAPPAVSPKPTLFKDLSVWYRLRPRRLPEILSLNKDRPLREEEYQTMVGGRQLFLPELMAVLPRTPTRVGDTWQIPRAKGQALLGKVPDDGDYTLDGTLVEVRKASSGSMRTAVFEISGELAMDEGRGAVKARIHFDFQPPREAPPAATPGASPKVDPAQGSSTASDRKQGIVDARGWISQVRMARTISSPISEDGRLQELGTRELILERRPATVPLSVPAPPPTANEANSWLVHDDPWGRFHFRHPQDMVPTMEQRDTLDLVNVRPDGGSDVFVVMMAPKVQDPGRNREYSDPEFLRRRLRAEWDKKGHDLVNGPSGWLPEADWAPLKRRVYRMEVAIKPKLPEGEGRNPQRFYLDYYLVVFTRNESVYFRAITDREDQIEFRTQAEAMIKSFELGPSEKQLQAPSATPPAPPGRPQ